MPTRARRKNLESQSQRAVIQWWGYAHKGLGVLWPQLLFAIPNGGLRDAITASILKAEGVRAGVPDLMLAVARGPYHGLFIEMKTATGTLSENQLQTHPKLIGQGYSVVVARGFDQATRAITEYLKIQ